MPTTSPTPPEQTPEGRRPIAILRRLIEAFLRDPWAAILTVVGLVLLFYAVVIMAQTKDLVWPALALIVLGNTDRFSQLSIGTGGIKVVREAREAIRELRAVALLVAEMELWSQNALGRLGGGGPSKKEEFRQRLFELLRSIGATEADIAAAFEPAAQFHDLDLVDKIMNRPDIDRDHPAFNIFAGVRARGVGQVPSPEELRKIIVDAEVLDEEYEKLLGEYERFRRHRDLRSAPSQPR